MSDENTNNHNSSLHAHVTWRQGRTAVTGEQIAGEIKLQDGVFTFTAKDGKELLKLDPQEINMFSVTSFKMPIWAIIPKTKQQFPLRFQPYFYGWLTEEQKKTDNRKYTDWIKAFKQAGINTRDYNKILLAFFITIIFVIIAIYSVYLLRR